MAVKQINTNEWQGLSTDTKPSKNTNIPIQDGSTFYEVDTKNGFIYHSGDICPTTNNNWWPV